MERKLWFFIAGLCGLAAVLLLVSPALGKPAGQLAPASQAGEELQAPVSPASSHQICYAVGDSGGGPPGDDLLTQVDYGARTETVIGSTGTFNVEAMTFQLETSTMFAADAGQLGTIDLLTGLFTPHPERFGTANGSLGRISINDVDGLSFHPFTGILYGTNRRDGDRGLNDMLFQINIETGEFIPNAFGPGVDYVVIPAGEITGHYDIDDLAFDVVTGELYAINNTSGVGDMLVILNHQTGGIDRIIGELSVDDMEALSFDTEGLLLGTTGKDGGVFRDRLWIVDKETGVADRDNSVRLTGGSDYEAVDCLASPPTAVELIYFRVESVSDDGVTLAWATAMELDHYGFKIYRSATPQIADASVVHFESSEPGLVGGEYTFTDDPPTSSAEWWYWLADVDVDGRETRYEPLHVSLSLRVKSVFQVYLPLGLKGP